MILFPDNVGNSQSPGELPEVCRQLWVHPLSLEQDQASVSSQARAGDQRVLWSFAHRRHTAHSQRRRFQLFKRQGKLTITAQHPWVGLLWFTVRPFFIQDKVFEQLESFAGIPFTIQRIAELLTTPKRHYRRTDKFMRALEKNMLVVSHTGEE